MALNYGGGYGSGTTGAALLGVSNTFTGSQSYQGVDKGSVTASTVSVNMKQTAVQKITVGADITLSFTNWSSNNTLDLVYLELKNGGSHSVSIPGVTWVNPSTVTPISTLAAYLTSIGRSPAALQTSGTDVIVIWSTDGGNTVCGKFV